MLYEKYSCLCILSLFLWTAFFGVIIGLSRKSAIWNPPKLDFGIRCLEHGIFNPRRVEDRVKPRGYGLEQLSATSPTFIQPHPVFLALRFFILKHERFYLTVTFFPTKNEQRTIGIDFCNDSSR